MIRILSAVVATFGLTFAADAEIGPLCQTPDGSLIVCHSRHGGRLADWPPLSDP